MTNLDALRTGLIVNGILILAAAVISALHQFAAAPEDKLWDEVLGDLKNNGLNTGFAFYVASGSAFFGCLPFSQIDVEEHLVFTVVWAFVFLVLFTLELAKARVRKGDAEGWTLTRVLAIPTGLAFAFWVWSGAGGLQ